MHHPDPYADDKILFTITGANADQYAEFLSPGQIALLKTYDTFKMNVYPTRRSASNPQRIYDATKKVAATATLVENGYGVTGAVIGTPFPIPKSGIEVLWNHLLRYRGDIASRKIAQAAPTRGGSYTLVLFEDEFDVLYTHEGATEESLNNKILYFKQKVTAPARLAGGILLVHETLNQVKEHRSAWLYNPGQRRVRRAPNVAYDNPGTASDGMRTSDQFDMFNGGVDRYDWKLVGKQELFVPYNAYKLHSDSLKYKDILTPLHALRASPGVGRRGDVEGRRASRVQAPDDVLRRGLVADPGGRPVRQPRSDLARVRRARHQLLRDAADLDDARGPHRSPGRPLSRDRTRQREFDVRFQHQAHGRGLHPGRAQG